MAKPKKPLKSDNQERFDDYANPLTGLGDYLQDKMFGGSQFGPAFLVPQLSFKDIEDRWRGSDLAARIVEAVPNEMTREGWELSIQPSEDEESPEEANSEYEEPEREDAFPPKMVDPQMAAMQPPPEPKVKPLEEKDDEEGRICEELEGMMDELCAHHRILLALQYERAYGGAAILVGADDGAKDLTKPLNEDNISEVRWLNVFAGGRDGEVIAREYYSNPRDAYYGEPEIYEIRNRAMPVRFATYGGSSAPKDFNGTSPFRVHASRLIVFNGATVSSQLRVDNQGWGDSIFSKVETPLSQFSQTWAGVANLMAQFHQDVLKVSGLAVGMAGGNKASRGNPLTARARTIQQTKSMVRMLLIDGEEEFERLTASLGGVDAVLQQFALRLAAAADMPVTLLMGQSPAGMNATGESDTRMWYDRVAAMQKRILLPQLKKLYRLLMLSKDGPTSGVEPEKWNIKFHPLYQLSDLEQAQMRKTVAETDKLYIDAGVLSPEEVATSTYGGSEWSMERTIDFEGRQKITEEHEIAKEEHAQKLAEMPKPDEPAVPPNGKPPVDAAP